MTASGAGFEVTNFGQVASRPVELQITGSGKELATATVPALQPFKTTVVRTKRTRDFNAGAEIQITVVIAPDAGRPECFETTITPE